jgi:transposase
LHELGPTSEQRLAPATNAAEVARLKREVAFLRQERDILKKAIGIFSRMPQ